MSKYGGAAGASVLYLSAEERTGRDSLYTHDPALITEAGTVILRAAKPARCGEGPAFTGALKGWDVPILGRVDGAATAEAHDMVWLDRLTLPVGRGFRTKARGLEVLATLLHPLGIGVIPVALPYWKGQEGDLHLDQAEVLNHR